MTATTASVILRTLRPVRRFPFPPFMMTVDALGIRLGAVSAPTNAAASSAGTSFKPKRNSIFPNLTVSPLRSGWATATNVPLIQVPFVL